MSFWLATGAHLNWADYSPLSRLTGLTDLQLAHCSGALPMHWLAAAPGLVRLYIKGNGAAAGQTVALAGGAAALSLLDNLEDLYLGLCEFTEADGALPGHVVCRRADPWWHRLRHSLLSRRAAGVSLRRAEARLHTCKRHSAGRVWSCSHVGKSNSA